MWRVTLVESLAQPDLAGQQLLLLIVGSCLFVITNIIFELQLLKLCMVRPHEAVPFLVQRPLDLSSARTCETWVVSCPLEQHYPVTTDSLRA